MTAKPAPSSSPQHSSKQVENMRESLTEAYKVEFQATEAWGLEVIKTLFLLNAAGLTGVFALVASVGTASSELPFHLFALGIASAVISMTFGRYMHACAAQGWFVLMEKLQDQPGTDVAEIPNLKIVKVLQCLSIVFAYSSGILCICAGIKLYMHF